ncbi:MAG: protein tyrosine phosphatase [Opitutales bacterium]|nr:protein tyrosine phosphatase [Opitutales bacterium]
MERSAPRKILFVCSINKYRSYTAEKMFDGFDRYQVRSRGTEKGARIRITEGDIGWADMIFTMEKRHTNRIREKYREAIRGKTVITLFIEDIYEPMEPALIEELTLKLRRYIQVPDFPRNRQP